MNPTKPHSIPRDQIKHIEFDYTVAGNYMVFVSTDRFIPLAIRATVDRSSGAAQDLVVYEEPLSRGVDDIYRDGWPLTTNIDPVQSATYFGDYIAKSPKLISIDRATFANQVALGAPANLKSYHYEFVMNVNTITYGANFKGKLYGVDFEGEFATSVREGKYPGPNNKLSDYTSQKLRSNVFQFKANRDFANRLNLSGDVYRIDPNYEPNLKSLQPSLYINKTSYAHPTDQQKGTYGWDYLVHPRPLSNDFVSIDDNEDGDLYSENDRRHYPSDYDESARGMFAIDGVLNAPVGGSTDGTQLVYLPTQMVMTYDDNDGVISNRYDKNKNSVVDYLEDFLLYYTDPPVFELGNDLNFNGIYDYADDDILPDYPYAVPYTLTSNGYRSHGLQGASLKLRVLPLTNLEVNVGGKMESAVNMDFATDMASKPGSSEGKSLVAYGNGMLRVVRRSQGLEFFLGDEMYYVKDAIRNDAVLTVDKGSYKFVVDPMRYRDAILTNFVTGVSFLSIPNFEVTSGAMLGLELHRSLGGELFYDTKLVRYLTDDGLDSLAYESYWQQYPERTIAKSYLMTKFGYIKKWNLEYEGWRRAFNILNRFEILPQYKIAYEFRRNLKARGIEADPRNDEKYGVPRLLSEDELVEFMNRWWEYDENTDDYIMSAPIVRCNFQIAERTKLEMGIQWQRNYDRITQTGSYSKVSKVAQIVSKDSYAGYNVSIMFGVNVQDTEGDTNLRDPILITGLPYNPHYSTVFARIYAGL